MRGRRVTAGASITGRGRGTSRAALLLAALGLLLAAELAWLATGAGELRPVVRGAFVLLCALAVTVVGLREVLLVAGAVALTLAALATGAGPGAVAASLDLAAFFAVFIAALTAVRDIAARSRSVRAVGRFLTGQPAGRRYMATALGGHVLGIFLNFGAVSLMAPMVQQAARGPDGRPSPDLERRQISALIRGFAWVILWAPTTLTQALLLTIFAAHLSWADVAPAGLGLAALMIAIGRLYDRFEWRGRALPGPRSGQPPPWPALRRVAAICSLMILATVALSAAAGFSVAQSLLFVAPAVSVAWFLCQPSDTGAAPGGPARLAGLARVFLPSAAGLARSAVALGASAYIGRLAALSLPTAAWAEAMDLASVPGWLFLAALPVLITLGGQVALSPILIVVFIGQMLQGVEALPTGHLQIYLALCFGWALSMTASPNATATLVISGACNIPATRLTWAWNLRYGLLCYAVAVVIFALIA